MDSVVYCLIHFSSSMRQFSFTYIVDPISTKVEPRPNRKLTQLQLQLLVLPLHTQIL